MGSNQLARVNDGLLWSELLELSLNRGRSFSSEIRHFFVLKDVVLLTLMFKLEKNLI